MTVTAREVHLARRPHGMPEPDDFTLVEHDLDDPGPGQVLVANHHFSVDPYMRGRMNDVPSYVPPFALDAVMDGRAVGEVVAVGDGVDRVAAGDLVLSDLGWRTHGVADATALQAVRDVPGIDPSAYLGVLGVPGLTAWVGLLDKARFVEGDTVFVSGAAGAVGSLVGQLARLKGASRVIGSAGSAEKVRWLTGELGYDAAFDYKDGDVTGQLRAAAPDGVDVYFDNVGGEHLEAAIAVANDFARVAACGAIAHYNDTEDDPTPGPAQPLPGREEAALDPGLHRDRLARQLPAVPRGGHAVGGRRAGALRRDRRRGRGERRRGLPWPAPRGEHREDDGQGLTVSSDGGAVDARRSPVRHPVRGPSCRGPPPVTETRDRRREENR